MIEIEYRDASYFGGTYGRKKVRRVEAVFGQLREFGETKAEAKAAMEAAILAQCEHAYDHRYLSGIAYDGEPVTFVFYFRGGWCYDIIRPREDGANSPVGSTGCNPSIEMNEAFEGMRTHFEQYTAQAA